MNKWLIGAGLAAGAYMLFSKKGLGLSGAVLRAARSLPEGGGYEMTSTGVPVEIRHQGQLILSKGAKVYCSGLTFAAVMLAAEQAGLLKDKTVAQIRAFQKAWYGGAGDIERQQGPAMEALGIGRNVPADQAQPGDFVQLWRTNRSGHSVVFLDWLREGGRIVGFRYRSAQPSTNGVGDSQERFSDAGGAVLRSRTYFSRLG